MKVIYRLDEHDLKKLLADHFEALEDDVLFINSYSPEEGVVFSGVQINTEIE